MRRWWLQLPELWIITAWNRLDPDCRTRKPLLQGAVDGLCGAVNVTSATKSARSTPLSKVGIDPSVGLCGMWPLCGPKLTSGVGVGVAVRVGVSVGVGVGVGVLVGVGGGVSVGVGVGVAVGVGVGVGVFVGLVGVEVLVGVRVGTFVGVRVGVFVGVLVGVGVGVGVSVAVGVGVGVGVGIASIVARTPAWTVASTSGVGDGGSVGIALAMAACTVASMSGVGAGGGGSEQAAAQRIAAPRRERSESPAFDRGRRSGEWRPGVTITRPAGEAVVARLSSSSPAPVAIPGLVPYFGRPAHPSSPGAMSCYAPRRVKPRSAEGSAVYRFSAALDTN